MYRAVVEHQRTDRDEPLRVTNVRMQYPMIFDWLDAHNVNAAVIITVMLLVALFNMIAALLIILLERTRMIGVLKTLGMGNGALQKMFVIRSSFIILRGMVWGNLIGIGLCLLQYFTGWITLDEQGYFSDDASGQYPLGVGADAQCRNFRPDRRAAFAAHDAYFVHPAGEKHPVRINAMR